jgi:Ni,Fe-hydrogenase III large subunit
MTDHRPAVYVELKVDYPVKNNCDVVSWFAIRSIYQYTSINILDLIISVTPSAISIPVPSNVVYCSAREASEHSSMRPTLLLRWHQSKDLIPIKSLITRRQSLPTKS